MQATKPIKQEAQGALKEGKALTTVLQVETLTESDMSQINGGSLFLKPSLVAIYTTLPSDYVEIHKLIAS